ncbi:MAG: hypothetical protein RLZZ224_935 [Verrucomicrobiota bacterium]|jgi:hypothetical protein
MDFLLFKKSATAKTERMRMTTMVAMTLAVLGASCAREEVSQQAKPPSPVGPPAVTEVVETPEAPPEEVDLSGQLREPNLLEKLEDGAEQRQKAAPPAASGPRPVVIRGGEATPVAEPPAPPLDQPSAPDVLEKSPQ